MKVTITEVAWDDLLRIGLWIKADNPARAASFVAELEERCKSLAHMAEAFPLVPGYEHTGIRRRPHGNYLIFYRIHSARIEILHVLNGAQDVEAILFPTS